MKGVYNEFKKLQAVLKVQISNSLTSTPTSNPSKSNK